jgi:hypothetical protein
MQDSAKNSENNALQSTFYIEESEYEFKNSVFQMYLHVIHVGRFFTLKLIMLFRLPQNMLKIRH